jgi:diaminohydroxyphosphoribosylaminopyrimidine deaminase/5-amino-6-(5-phosphoribosylamino)uracil reductase
LEAAGVVVEAASPELQDWCRWINRRFLVSVEEKRPYLVLKWAQTPAGGMDAARTAEHPGPFPVSSPEAQVVVHQWRSEEDAILVGARTWDLDRPQLNARLVGGRAPRRLVLGTPSIALPPDVLCFVAPEDAFAWCTKNGIRSVLVEGGASVLASFLRAGWWDELRVLTQDRPWTPSLWAPSLPNSAQRLTEFEQHKRGYPKQLGTTECRVYLRKTDPAD